MQQVSIISTEEIAIPEQVQRRMARNTTPAEAERFSQSRYFSLQYQGVSGLKIRSYLLLPPLPPEGRLPAIVFNRGGAGVRGALNEESALATIAHFAAWGYAVIASNYRGQGGSEGTEEWGAGDVQDATDALTVLQSQPYIDADRIGLVAGSRGGMMGLMMLRNITAFRAAVTFGAPTDFTHLQSDSYIRQVLEKYLPSGSDYAQEAEKRSACVWADELAKNTPLLILHGTGDKRVEPEHSLRLAMRLQQLHHPYKLIMYDNADHVLAGRREESNADIRWWIDTYVRDKAPLPKTGPHGA